MRLVGLLDALLDELAAGGGVGAGRRGRGGGLEGRTRAARHRGGGGAAARRGRVGGFCCVGGEGGLFAERAEALECASTLGEGLRWLEELFEHDAVALHF